MSDGIYSLSTILLLIHNNRLNLFPDLAVQQEIGDGVLGGILEIEKHVLDAWGIGIFIGFDSYDLDALLLKGGEELLALPFGKPAVA